MQVLCKVFSFLYYCFNISKITLGSQSERCVRRSRCFRLKVRGERLKARGLCASRGNLGFLFIFLSRRMPLFPFRWKDAPGVECKV